MAVVSPVLVLTNQLHTGGAEVYVVTVSRWLKEQGGVVAVAAAPGELASALAPGVSFFPIPLKDVRLALPVAIARVARLVRELQPRVILANSLVTAVVAKVAGAPWGIPVVTVAHGWPADRYRLIARPLGVADVVVAVSADVARRLQRAGLRGDRITIVPNGVDLSPFGPRDAATLTAARAAMGAGPDDVVAVSVGRYVAQKAQHRLIEAVARLAPTHPHLKLAIVGWGEREAELEALAARLGVADRVRLMGRRTDVPDLLLAADLYVSASDWEGMPLSMIEAMAAGLPVLTTDVEGISALVDDDNGVRVPLGDDEAFVDAFGRLAGDELSRLQRGAASRARAEAKFSKGVMCRNLHEVLARVARP